VKFTEVLCDEHQLIKKALEVLNSKVEEACRTGRLDVSFMKKFIQFSREFIDRCHQAKEEKCFFKCLEKRGIPCDEGPVSVIIFEHELGRNLVKRLNDAVMKYGRGEADIGYVLDRFIEYAELLNQHMYKEENILYPLGDAALKEEDQREAHACAEQFNTLKKETFAELVHEREG